MTSSGGSSGGEKGEAPRWARSAAIASLVFWGIAFMTCIYPAILFETSEMESRAAEQLPWAYQRSVISSGLASRLVYREGLTFVEALPDSNLATYSECYLRGERRTRELADRIAAAGLQDAGAEVHALLMKGGVRAAAEMEMMKSTSSARTGAADTTAPYPIG